MNYIPKADDVVILLMDNPQFHRMIARVVEPTEYGAEVEVESHTYPHRKQWRLRAVFAEMLYIGTLADKYIPAIKSKEVIYGDQHRSKSNEIAQHKWESASLNSVMVPATDVVVKEGMVYLKNVNTKEVSGDMCKCGGLMVRTGTCMTCQTCGSSSGGCS